MTRVAGDDPALIAAPSPRSLGFARADDAAERHDFKTQRNVWRLPWVIPRRRSPNFKSASCR